MRKTWLIYVLFALAFMPQLAAAEGSVRVLGGWGFNDSFHLGFGGTAGIHVPMGLRKAFLGVRGVYHAGSNTTLPLVVPGGGAVGGDMSMFVVGGELGTIWLEHPVVVRVSGDAGFARLSLRPDTGGELNQNKFSAGSSIVVGKPLGTHSFWGVELKWMKVDGLDHTIGLYVTLGSSFD